MPFADNQGARIHYQTVGSGPALVLHHGTLGSGAHWADLGYVDALKEDHQLILLTQEDMVRATSLTILLLTPPVFAP